MTTLTRPDPPNRTAPGPSGLFFEGMCWDDYEAMLRLVGERPIRVTYDRGTMEAFMPSFGHEDDAHLLGRIVETLAEELEISLKAGRTTTHKRKDLDRGVEPDQSYWFGENARRMVGKRQLDLGIDPAPNLVIEVDVASRSLPRLPIFAAMGIGEVWRREEGRLEFLQLEPDGTYRAQDRSRNFPTVSAADVAEFLEAGRTQEETAWVRTLRASIRERFALGPEAGRRGDEPRPSEEEA